MDFFLKNRRKKDTLLSLQLVPLLYLRLATLLTKLLRFVYNLHFDSASFRYEGHLTGEPNLGVQSKARAKNSSFHCPVLSTVYCLQVAMEHEVSRGCAYSSKAITARKLAPYLSKNLATLFYSAYHSALLLTSATG